MELTGKVALVTGGGRGIGRATALALAKAGADVALAARSEAELKSVAKGVAALGRRVATAVCDVSRMEDCRRAVETAVRELGRLDILVNNAGGGDEHSEVVDSDPERWRTSSAPPAGVSPCCHAALPHISRRRRQDRQHRLRNGTTRARQHRLQPGKGGRRDVHPLSRAGGLADASTSLRSWQARAHPPHRGRFSLARRPLQSTSG